MWREDPVDGWRGWVAVVRWMVARGRGAEVNTGGKVWRYWRLSVEMLGSGNESRVDG